MAIGDRELVVRVVGDASSLEKTFRKASASSNRFGKDIGKTGRGAIAASGIFQSLGRSVAFASAGFLGGFGLAAGVKAAFDEMSQAQKVAAQTASAIKSTGGVAGVTAKHVDTLATSLLNLSGVDDEAIKGAENLLLTFTSIRNVVGKNNDIFDQATRSALDLSVRFNKDLGSSAVLVGKALQDPIRGLTALVRVGVQFTDQQKKNIKALVESGHVLEAQKIILAELRRETGGAAAAAGDTLAGKLNIAKETILNMGGAIAVSLLPMLTRAADQLDRWLKNPENQKKVVDDLSKSIKVLAGAFGVLAHAIEGDMIIVNAFVSAYEATVHRVVELASHLPKHAGQWARDLKKAWETTQPGEPPVGARGPITAADIAAGAVPPPSGTIPAAGLSGKDQRRLARAAREALRQQVVDMAALAVDRAGLTKGLGDDLAALQKLNALLKRRIAGGHDTIALQQQQLSVEQQIASLVEQQAEARKAARDARQFRRLGFGPTGEDLVPGVKALKRQLDSVREAVEGSFLDTRKTKGLLGHIRQVLSGGLGSVSSEVRSKVQQILADLKAQLKKSSVDITRFQTAGRGQFALAGATPAGAGNIVVTGGIHLHGVQDLKDLENQLARRTKQRAHARRSTR